MNGGIEKKQAVIIFALVVALALGTRLCLAVRNRTCLNGDEAIVGVMAFDIQDRGVHPVFLYTSDHGGGHTVDAHVAALLNSVFGRRVPHVLVSPVAAFAVFAGVCALLAIRAAGFPLGILVGLHLIFAPFLFRPSLRAAGYMETLAMMSVCCYIALGRMMGDPNKDSAGQKPPGVAWGLLTGFLCGLAYWWLEFSAVMSAALFAAYALRWRRRALPVLAAWAAAFPVGAAALVYENIRNGFMNLQHLAQGHALGAKAARPPFLHFFTRELPAFFQNDNVDFFPSHIPSAAWLLFGATMLGCAVALFFALKGRRQGVRVPVVLVFGFFYCIFYSAVYLVSPFRGETARYLLPLEPFMSVGLAAGVAALIGTRRAAGYILAGLIVICVIIADVNGTRFAWSDGRINDSYDADIACGEIDGLVSLLDSRGITNVFTNRFLKWIIIFETEERIKASDPNLIPRAAAWTEYDDAVTASANPAFLFNRKDSHVPWLEVYLRARGIGFGVTESGRYVLIEPASRVSQFDFMDWSRRMHEKTKKK